MAYKYSSHCYMPALRRMLLSSFRSSEAINCRDMMAENLIISVGKCCIASTLIIKRGAEFIDSKHNL
jgi:hypothetical protein